MRKALTLLFGLMIAAIAVWAVPKDIKKDVPGIEKAIQLKIEAIKNQVTTLVTITEQGESPGQLVQNSYNFVILEQVAEESPALPVDYPFNWRSRNFVESTKRLTEIKLTMHRSLRRLDMRC